jgi:hypothetical protein
VNPPADLQFDVPHPMPQPNHAPLLASYHLLLEQAADAMRVQVRQPPSASPFEAWEVTRAALMARMAGTLRHLGYLAPSSSPIDGIALARTLVDHVITFAWLSANPPQRLPRFLRSSYGGLLTKDERAIQRGEDALLTDEVRTKYEEYTRTQPQGMPNLYERSTQADESLRGDIATALPPSLDVLSFADFYNKVYGGYADYDHPSTLGLGVFMHRDVNEQIVTIDGQQEHNPVEDLQPYWMAAWAFAEALLVSSLTSTRPRREPLRRALEIVGTIRIAQRDGRLGVTTTGDRVSISIDRSDT